MNILTIFPIIAPKTIQYLFKSDSVSGFLIVKEITEKKEQIKLMINK